MERSKTYKGISLLPHGWNLLIKAALRCFNGDVRNILAVTYKDGGSWSYDHIEDFLADFDPLDSRITVGRKIKRKGKKMIQTLLAVLAISSLTIMIGCSKGDSGDEGRLGSAIEEYTDN